MRWPSDKKRTWHTYFAWLPVTILHDGGWHTVWLEPVERRLTQAGRYGEWFYEYRCPTKDV